MRKSIIKDMSQGQLGTADEVYGFKGECTVESTTQNPPEIAARLGTLELIGKIKGGLRP